MNGMSVSFWISLGWSEYLSLLIVANLLMFLATGLIVTLLRKYFIQFDLNSTQTQMSQRDYQLAIAVLAANILVGVIGFYLLSIGWIQLRNKTLVSSAVDMVLLMGLIDIGMYFSHRVVHKTFLYRLLHQIHHEHESMAKLSLYVMHPLEAFGFGMILITILIIYPVDLVALLVFLLVNWLLGVFAHSGIEPSRGELANYLCMTRFHQIHHENPSSNFGFYTPILDTILRTRSFQLRKEM